MHSFVVPDLKGIGGLVDPVVPHPPQLERLGPFVLAPSDPLFGATHPWFVSNLLDRHVHKSLHIWRIDIQ